jgi:putative nucleotidyltransferase with HDIG domain
MRFDPTAASKNLFSPAKTRYVRVRSRPAWLETPFYLQGFMVRDGAEIQKLALCCDYVHIDQEKSIANFETSVAHKTGHNRKLGVAATPFDKELSTRNITHYRDQAQVTAEIKNANSAYENIRAEFDDMASRINNGRALNISNLNEVVNPLVETVIRNPAASIWLAKLKCQDSYTYRHCLAVAIWCAVIGREIGLPKKELAQLSTGGMLLDIGKLKLPAQLLNKTEQLSDREFTLVRKHVELSLKMARDSSRPLPQAVIDMIAYHHERFNGYGYPNGLQGTQIPLYARIAAIADCYDAITSHRVYAEPIAHATALKKMYEWRGYDFQPELIEAFIQSVGIYPTGTLVELSSAEEHEETHSHIELGLSALVDSHLPEQVVSTIQYHHERSDGSGYPAQLRGTNIPLYARIAAIVECYDAMTSPRYYATPVAHSEAIMKLASWRKTLFQKELVDTFIQAIGLYPPGSLLELTNGEVAVVSDFRPGMGRKPELTVILDREKNACRAKRC